MVQSLTEAPGSREELVDEVRSWLELNWDPDLTVGEWWERLGLAGWSAPTLPPDAYGRGVSRSAGIAIAREITEFGALGAPNGLGLMLAAPTIADHGTQEQIDLFVRDIVTGQRAWCQLFSEPGAGSDLAGLSTRAVEDGDEWVVNGQKVWTSLGQSADLAMLLARTDPDLPKHQGITYFALDMRQPGVEVRPLREMTGHAMFNETFITDARVPASSIIGGRGNGWAVANTTLGHERAGLGAGGGNAGAAVVTAGTVAGNLSRRVGDFVSGPGASSPKGRTPARRGPRTAGRPRPAHRAGPRQRHERRWNGPPGPGPALHPRGPGPLQHRAVEGQPRRRPGHPGYGQSVQAVDEHHRAAPA